MESVVRTKLEGLESLRWFAAASIILFHVATIPDHGPPRSIANLEPYLNYGVPLFYVVSAFGLWYGYLGRLTTRAAVTSFYKRRFFRIAPLFYLLLIVYSVVLPEDFSVPKLVTSVLFVFNLVPTHVEGIVWASWSIGVEMLLYAFLPLVAMFVRETRHAIALFVGAVITQVTWHWLFQHSSPSMRTFAHFSIVNYVAFFAAGILALMAFIEVRASERWQPRYGLDLLRLAIALMALLILIGHPSHSLVRIGWSVALSCLVVGVSARPVRGLVNGVTQRLGEASFSLYLLHPMTIGVFDKAGLIDEAYSRFGGVGGYLVIAVCVFAVVIPASLMSYQFVERRGMRLGGGSAVATTRH